MALGKVVKFGSDHNWMASDPIYRDNMLYFALGSHEILSDYDYLHDDDGNQYDDKNAYVISTRLRGYDCTNSNAPEKLPEISIPGMPDALLEHSRLVCVEQFDYYQPYPYPILESNMDGSASVSGDDTLNQKASLMPRMLRDVEKEPLMPPDVEQGIRINVVDLSSDGAVLDATAFFDQDEFGYSQIVCDEKDIYLVSWQEDITDVRRLDPDTLEIIDHYSIESQLSPVKASNGMIVFTDNYFVPYWRNVYDTSMPYWNNMEIRVFDFSGSVQKELLKVSADYYLSKKNVEIGSNALYIADGYKGVVILPFN